jgi:hypothetical protein
MGDRSRFGIVVIVVAVAASFGVQAALLQVASAAPPPQGAKYVAIGSSYAAGPGIPNQMGGACARSDHNYPHLVAAALHLNLDDVSCSGAVTANAINTPQGAAPPQINAVSPDTRLVTLTIGGNDVGYAATSFSCGMTITCTSAPTPAQLHASFAALPGSLTALIALIRAKAPSATIILVTYPRLVPPSPCAALHYSPAGVRLVASIGQRLEAVFVRVARATRIRIADPYVIGASRGPCAPRSVRWVAGLRAPNGFPYHPTAVGHVAMASLVERQLGVSTGSK